MIVYEGKLYGFGLILRLHGSAAARAVLPAALSTLLFFLIYQYIVVGTQGYNNINQNKLFAVGVHPYVFAALIGFFGFLLTYRATYSYNRYWDGSGAVFQMLSKYGDVGNLAAAFHMQSKYYDAVMPPSFGNFPEIRSVVQQRVRSMRPTLSDLEQQLIAEEKNHHRRDHSPSRHSKIPSIPDNSPSGEHSTQNLDVTLGPSFESQNNSTVSLRTNVVLTFEADGESAPKHENSQIPATTLTNNEVPTNQLLQDRPSYRRSGQSNEVAGFETPSLFLQELCHRLSLLGAVSMATLRNIDQGTDLPLVGYTPGEPLPPVDPDALSRVRRREYHEQNRVWTFFKYLFGLTRSNRHRTLYSYARPFRVLGGVSDAENASLHAARGEHAKVMLCQFWLQEFLIREHLHGSMGTIAPPIVSRIFQEVNSGTMFYSQARKIAKIPFPFPHAQLASIFTFVLGLVIPLLFISFSNYLWFGAVMNFFTVLCFVGMHEVARELENPFQNAPNDIPLMTMQAEFNEALVTLQSGYHPDSYWSVVE